MIHLKQVDLIYHAGENDAFPALSGIDFQVAPNELVLIQGASGSGKSSLLSLIAGLRRPSSGDVLIDGRSRAKIPVDHAARLRQKKIGMIFQSFHLIPDLTALDNIILPLIPTPVGRSELLTRARKLLEMLDLQEKSNLKARLLSGGEQQRVAIARALINRPLILLADEPTANLDGDLIETFISLLTRLKADGMTLLLASHDPRLATLPGIDRSLQLHRGRLA